MNRAHHWSDWAGFLVFTLIWVGVLKSAPALGLMTVPLLLHPILSSAGFLLRKPLIASASGVLPRLLGYAATFGVVLCLALFQARRPLWIAPTANTALRAAGLALWGMGAAFDLYTVWSLRHGMSIIPQARTLITTGPYRFARHPLYAAYILQNTGVWLRFQSWPVALVVLGWFLITLLRVRYEERVLAANFPEYQEYRQRTAMFFPRWKKQLAVGDWQLAKNPSRRAA
jgi:protein-S-isoprenylcysteine O-methyltransferase Ste14